MNRLLPHFVFFLFLLSSLDVGAISFNDAIKRIGKHHSVEAQSLRSKVTHERSRQEGSWGDVKVQVAAKNFPTDSLSSSKTPMTGLEFGLSQKISLTTKYSNLRKSKDSLALAQAHLSKDTKESLIKKLWENLIEFRKLKDQQSILKENLAWLVKTLKVSKKLYVNGKISQQALLEIQIRKSEIENDLGQKKFELLQLKDELTYLISNGQSYINERTIPWSLLSKSINKKKITDFKELALKQGVESSNYQVIASKLNYIPDPTVSVSMTKRSDLDGHGDFIGAKISFPLPTSSTSYSKHNQAVNEKYQAVRELKNYQSLKQRNSLLARNEIKKLTMQLDILTQKTIRFATNSRTITSKSYGLGNSSYLELLKTELKLQELLMLKTNLIAKRDRKRVELKYILGESLHE